MILLDGTNLSAALIEAAAKRRADVTLAPAALDRVSRAHQDALEVTRPVYGRDTGVGANRSVRLAEPTASAGTPDPALALLRSHASSSGELRSPERVRAMLVVRINQLAAGGSGIDPMVVTGLLDMLRADALPPVRELGSVGTGDLGALATTGLALLGEVATSSPLPGPVPIGITDALPLLSSNAAAIGDAALGTVRLTALARAALVVAAATFFGVAGNSEAFAPAVERVTPFDGARRVCQTMRALTAGAGRPARIQDPYGLRALPQVHGPLLDSLTALDDVVARLANAAAENPAYRPGGEVVHHAGFHAAYLAVALDAARLALAQAAQLSLARLSMLCAPELTGLPAFLADERPGASGLMVVEYVVGSALGRLRALATPTALQTVALSRGVEEDASFAGLAATQLLDAVPAYRTVLAGELVAAVRCLRMRGLAPAPLAALLEAGTVLNADLADRDLTDDLGRAEQILTDGIGAPVSG